ncbi:MAG: DUF4919 domain-containing protein [Gammaproteobacteria bacterium]
MMRYLAFLLVLFAASAMATPAPTPEEYAALKAKLLGGDAGVDYFALRLGHAASPDYHPNSPDSLIRRKAVQNALEAKQFDEAKALVEHWLDEEFLNPFAHLGAIRVYKELGDAQKLAFHNAVVDGLFASICRADEGESVRRPCRVLSIDEQHFYLVMNGMMVDGQYGRACFDEQPCEVYEVTKMNTNRKYTLYFDISLPLAWQDARRKEAAAAPVSQKP